jgi:hypothetical protein
MIERLDGEVPGERRRHGKIGPILPVDPGEVGWIPARMIIFRKGPALRLVVSIVPRLKTS